MLPISLMKGDEVIEGCKQSTDLVLLSTTGWHRQLSLKEVGRSDIEQPMVSRTFRRNRLHALVPAIGLVVRDEELWVDIQGLESDVKGRYAALFVSLESLHGTPWAISRRALVICKLAFVQEVVAT